MSAAQWDVTVLGGGVVGRCLALLLARQRLRVALVERCATATGAAEVDVRAYALNAASRALLREAQAWPADRHATPVRAMWVADTDHDVAGSPQPVATLRFDAPAPQEPLAWIVDVAALEQALEAAVERTRGIERLHGEADTAPRAALTVVCEGRHSSTRAAAGIAWEAVPYPHTALAARLRCARPHGAVARQWFHGEEIIALLPLDGVDGDRVALVWSVPRARAERLLKLAPEAFAAELQAACGAALGDMALESAVAGWPLQRALARPWVRPGLALAGDAAHAMHPLAGQGLNTGLGDVAELVRVLREREYWRPLGDLRLLRRYERARAAPVAAMLAATDALHGLFADPNARVTALRRWGLRAVDRLEPLKRWFIQQASGQLATL
ncbi:2-octaprenylphenol hydroxylase [Tepidimonas alkaliphilus]|uniref:2-octaprenylphenol hydroxylase n=1 Tax=Tepidimonas alkaliphilus TaxID=2588942 RepID=A0A554W3R1_9BURK|nr:FAD-dependent monooxygenase [Tepidimonas alkaliphilus]TSE18199.1 2-octaprenylphenol hydroxylase [Tepidimonas alkaliphilus]